MGGESAHAERNLKMIDLKLAPPTLSPVPPFLRSKCLSTCTTCHFCIAKTLQIYYTGYS